MGVIWYNIETGVQIVGLVLSRLVYPVSALGGYMLVYILFVLGLLLIIKGGDSFVTAAVAIARRIGMSELVIGATIVSLGTTLPEVLVSTLAGLSGSADIAVGNSLGSIICNTSLIAGIVLVLSPPSFDKSMLTWRTLYFYGALGALFVVSYLFGGVSRIMGLVFVLMFCIYTYLSARQRKIGEEPEDGTGPMGKTILTLVISAAALFVGARLLVDNGVLIATNLGIPERFIASTFIALGTSLPELVTAIMSVKIGMAGMSIGNILGANILNVLCVIGIPAAIASIAVSQAAMMIDIPMAAFVMLILTLPPALTGKTYRMQGFALLACYVGYVTVLA